MNFYIDQSGAPLVRLAYSNEFIQVIPFTCYQLQKVELPVTKIKKFENQLSIAPVDLTKENLISAFLTGVTFQEAYAISSYYNLKLPSLDQIQNAHSFVFSENDLFKKTLDFLAKNKLSKNKKLEELIEFLLINSISRDKINCKIAEFASTFHQKPYGSIFTFKSGNSRELLSLDRENVCAEDFGFSCVLV